MASIYAAACVLWDAILYSLPVVVLAALSLWCCSLCCGQVYQIRSDRGGMGSAVCVGGGDRDSVCVTAGHMFKQQEKQQEKWTLQGVPIREITTSKTEDLAVFEVDLLLTQIRIAEEIPEGTPVMACGYSPTRRDFCFSGSVTVDRVEDGYADFRTSSQHVEPGDSGGAVFVETGGRKCLAGMIVGYPEQREFRGRSTFVTSRRLCQFLTRRYGSCPQCVPVQSPGCASGNCPQYTQPGLRPAVPSPQPAAAVPPRVSVEICQDDLRRMVADELAKLDLRGPAGQQGPPGESVDPAAVVAAVMSQIRMPQDGSNGRDGKSVSAAEVAAYLVANHRAEITGPAGERGPQGLVGVPDDQDIRNWLVGAMSDPATRQQLSGLLTDLVATDPRVDDLIRRLEALENRPVSGGGDVGAIAQRLTALENRPHSQRVLLVDGSTRKVLDDETYTDEPIVLDVRKFTGASK
jgi:hypothetical protein